jgi:hypothetical protein
MLVETLRADWVAPATQARVSALPEFAGGACANWAEGYFSRLRRAEIGHHHHVAGASLLCYAQESSWHEDHRRVSNGDQVAKLAGLVICKRASPNFTGYWQRHQAA